MMFLCSSTSLAAIAATRPTQAIAREGCVTAVCHANVKQFKVLHGPVNVNACDACHKLTNPATHTFELARNKTETCTFCHQIDTRNNPVVHKPLTDGQCLACHNPHGGNSNKFTRGNSMRELCATCHKDPVGQNTHVHGPVAAGACDSCHQGHSSKVPKLLVAQGRDLCLTCHAEMKTQMAKVKFTHKAVAEGDCANCHDPHASPYTMQIKKDPLALCSTCHEKQKTAAMNATFKHSVVTRDAACLNCHTAHGGDLAKLMRNDPIKVCMKCHQQDQKDPTGRVVHNVAMVLDPRLSKHGPINDGNCAGCHNTHGSDVSRLLKAPYPEAFYQPFSEDKYQLCFSCHDKQLVEQPKTANLTGFRNGDRNLHFVHVNRDKGRNCRSCHETHASRNDRHIRDSVPFGQWEMPIKYAKSDTGGSCSPGCHKPFTYDRNRPIDYGPPLSTPPATPTPTPTPTPAPALTQSTTPTPGQSAAPPRIIPPAPAPSAPAAPVVPAAPVPSAPVLPPVVNPPPAPKGS
jgi:predicted CXXCH cytochrome family protein